MPHSGQGQHELTQIWRSLYSKEGNSAEWSFSIFIWAQTAPAGNLRVCETSFGSTATFSGLLRSGSKTVSHRAAICIYSGSFFPFCLRSHSFLKFAMKFVVAGKYLVCDLDATLTENVLP